MTATATQTLKCPACGSYFRAEDLDAARDVLTCSFCRSLTLFRDSAPSRSRPPARPAVALPRGVAIDEPLDGGVVIRRRWFSPRYLFLLVFCAIWFGFLAFFYAAILRSQASGFVALFPLIHVAVGLGIAYATLAGFLNTTTITVRDEAVAVRHGPVPWRGRPSLPASRITQLYCKERIHRGKHGTTTTYEVWAARDEDGALKLVGGLDEPEQALFVEQRIEKALGLADRPMPGELPR